MKTWYKLTPEEITQIYCVPAAIANNPTNHFWCLTYQYPQELFEGDWPLVVLRSNEGCPSVVTLQIHTLPIELLHVPTYDNAKEEFNPLEETGGGNYLLLPVEQIKGLCKILYAQKPLFVDDKSIATKHTVFRLLHNDEVQFYRLHPEWFPGVQRACYIQEAQSGSTVAQRTISLITISNSSKLNRKISFAIMTFDQNALLDKDFTPLRRSQSKLYLNWAGLLEVVTLLSQAIK